jgi:hypothetical protein
MSPDPRVRRGAHRTSRAATATLLPSLLAILAVTSLITALYVWRGEDAKPPSAAAAGASRTSASPAATVSTKASPEQTNEPVATTSSPPAKKPKTGALLRADIAIVVLNDTVRPGLASTVATQLRSKGWAVTGVGNFRGLVSATTVYYPIGHAAAAQAAAKSLPTPPRVLPRFGNLSTTRLTVVVAANYPG